MAQTVLIYATRRQRVHLARQGIEIVSEYRDYVLARATAEQVDTLQGRGFEVEVFQPATEAPVARSLRSAPAEEPPTGPPPETYGPGHHYYLVEFIGPVNPDWLDAITAHGGQLKQPMPPNSYIVALDAGAYEWLTSGAGFVARVTHYSPAMRLSPDLAETLGSDPLLSRGALRREAGEPAPGQEAAGQPPSSERIPNVFTVRFFEADDLGNALAEVHRLGGSPTRPASGSTVLTVSFPPGDPNLAEKVHGLAALHGVRSVEPFVLRQLRNDVAASLMGAEEVLDPSGLGLSGRGELVGVADSGLDSGDPVCIHPDFAGRVLAVYSWPVASDWSAVVDNAGQDDGPADARSGHGTHVAASVMGSGKAARAVQAAAVRGLAYDAKLVFQAVEQRLLWSDQYRATYYRRYRRYPPEFGLAGLPVDLRLLFKQAYDAGVRVHNNSWGGGDFGAYDDFAETVDRFMWEHKDFLILFAAGNDGADADRDGLIDPGSITPPGTAKNCITVGASESLRAEGGYQAPYGRLWPNEYGVMPLKDDLPSDAAEDLAAFSSRGPTRDGRVKPDLVAPGTNILSARSRALPADAAVGWGTWGKSDLYVFNGGTSMASPLAAGAAAVVREYLRVFKRRRQPSAALVKAILIHGARRLAQRYEVEDAGVPYSLASGWGHLWLRDVLAPPEGVRTRFYEHRRGLNTGESWKWRCRVSDPTIPLSLTLTWTDYPGSAGNYPNLTNDLDLVVFSPTSQVYYGNHRMGQPGGAPDRINNVERVMIPQPEPGVYTIRVRGFNILHGPQDFALVYSGGIA